MGLRSAAIWPQYFFEAYLKVFLSRWMTHVCTVAWGNTAPTESGSPFRPSQTMKNTSSTPRFFSSVSTCSQNFADSPFPVPAHSPRTSLWPARSTPIAT